MATHRKKAKRAVASSQYDCLVGDISALLEQSRRGVARAVNSILTATYWEIGRRIVEFEQGGKARAEYGERLIGRLARDLKAKYGRGFSERNLWNMKDFYLGWEILQAPSAEFEARAKCQRLTVNSAAQPIPPNGVGGIRRLRQFADGVCRIWMD